jgi:hypothetical protein
VRLVSSTSVLLALISLLPLVPAAALGGEKFACEMNALTKAERARHGELSHALLGAVVEKKELADGYGFRLPADELTRAAEWVSLERKCCPFFTFELEQARDGGPLWLRIKGTEGVKAFIKTEFGL